MAKAKKTETTDPIGIKPLQRSRVVIYVVGTTPLMMNRLAKKAKEELLLPRRTLNKAARQATLKHNPPEEFRDSVYRCRDGSAPAFVHVPNNAFKKSMASAALDMEGATKAQVGRLIKIEDMTVHIYGKPFLHMCPVRLAGFAKTPDIRTRAYFPEWACKITVKFVRPQLREQDIANLMDAAGDIIGIGDGRTEKGTFDFGSWRVVEPNDRDWHRIVKTQGRKVQEAAMAKPEAADEDTEELLSWYYSEIIKRERDDRSERDVTPKRRALAGVAGKARGGTKGRNNGHATA